MTKYIVLLRGVTPTGKNRVPMAQLRYLLTESGFENVQTWIQSGNIILDSDRSVECAAEEVHQVILRNIGADLKIIVKTPDQIQTVLDENPFTDGYQLSRVFFTLFNTMPDEKLVLDLQAQDFGEDKLTVTHNAIYLYVPGSFAKTKINNNALERKLKIDATTRNFNTLSKLVTLSTHP